MRAHTMTTGHFSPQGTVKLSVVAAALLVSTSALAAIGDTATFNFNLPSTAVASQNPPYPSVAELVLIETATGVDFTLSPTWTVQPLGRFGAESFIERLHYVYAGPALTAANFSATGGAPVTGFAYNNDPNNSIDSGYKDRDQNIFIDWGSKNDPDRFDIDHASSSWSISGTVLTNFTGTASDHASHPTPAFGVISVTAYSLEGPKPTPSNWVAGVVPEPETYAMMLAGLAAVGFMARRRKSA